MRILLIFGTRPEAIKLAPVFAELQRRDGVIPRVCVTAQHRHMLDQVLNLFAIPVDRDLDLMRDDQSLFQVTAGALSGLESVLQDEKPDVVLVQGDTTTTFAGALAAYYRKIPVGHVEAGLRSGDPYDPFPEEANRRLVDTLSDWCFCPTEGARKNLLAEGVSPEKIFVTGNTVVDALQAVVNRQKNSPLLREMEERLSSQYGFVWDPSARWLLVTGHRRESFGPDFESICHGLRRIAEQNPDVRILYPAHLNPNVQEPVRRLLGGVSGIHLIEPLDYVSLVWLLSRCTLVLTDSGGIQEEAPSFGKPVLVLRKTTERPEGIAAGVAKLVGTDSGVIAREAQRLLDDPAAYNAMSRRENPYGDGHAGRRIVDLLLEEAAARVSLSSNTPSSADQPPTPQAIR